MNEAAEDDRWYADFHVKVPKATHARAKALVEAGHAISLAALYRAGVTEVVERREQLVRAKAAAAQGAQGQRPQQQVQLQQLQQQPKNFANVPRMHDIPSPVRRGRPATPPKPLEKLKVAAQVCAPKQPQPPKPRRWRKRR
jgi:hypothetical protein